MSSELDLDTESETNRNAEGAESLGVLESRSRNCQDESENNEPEEEQLLDQLFSIPLIFKEILKQLDIKDLLRTSLVNKYWNVFSREVMQEHKICLANVSGYDFCYNLKTLNDVLSNSNTVPFNGISVWIWPNENHECLSHTDLFSELMNNVLSKIDFKFLSVLLYTEIYVHEYNTGLEYIALECIQEMMTQIAGSLKRLRIDVRNPPMRGYGRLLVSPGNLAKISGLNAKGQWLPNVRVLSIPIDYFDPEGSSMVKQLIEASPNLQKLYGTITVEWLDLILRLKAARVVKDFDFVATRNSLRICAAFLQENPQLEKLRFSTDDWWRFRDSSVVLQNKVSEILRELIRRGQQSLQTFACNHYDLVLITFHWNIPVLKKVTQLRLQYVNDLDDQEGYGALRKIEWTKYFPYLKEIYLTDTFGFHGDSDFYIGQYFRKSNVESVCESVKKLHWMLLLDSGEIQMLKNVFPNVKEFYFKGCREWEFPLILMELWTAWPDVELIYASFDIRYAIPNYDSVFFGLTKADAVGLPKNIEDLESLGNVLTRPCIFSLQKLQKFIIRIGHDKGLCRKTHSTSDAVFLSRIVGQFAFAKIPGLEVEIYRHLCYPEHNCRFTLDDIKPFVKCVE